MTSLNVRFRNTKPQLMAKIGRLKNIEGDYKIFHKLIGN